MTDITAKPFDWNDNLSKEALEEFEEIRKDLPYCTCQNIGMALAKLELLEKQGCKVIDPDGSSSEKPNKSEIPPAGSEARARWICCPMCDKKKCEREADDCDVKIYLRDKAEGSDTE